jgi:uncharacterized protein YceK
MPRTLIAVCALVVLLGSGCGTIISKSTSGGSGGTGLGHVYSGVRCDAAAVRGMSSSGAAIPIGLAAVVDLPFSLFEDTAFLPFDLVMSSEHGWDADRACGPDRR